MKGFIRKLTKTGKYTYYIVVPKALIRRLRWRERQKLVIKQSRKGLSIKDWTKKKKHD